MNEDVDMNDSSSEDMELLEVVVPDSPLHIMSELHHDFETRLSSSSRLSLPRIKLMKTNFALKYFIAAASFGLAMDQNLIAPNMTAIADEFNMDHKERDKKIGGGLAFAFFLLGAPAAIGIGFAADHYNRRDLLSFTTLLGGVATLGSGLSFNYASLFWTRALAGAAVGGMMPLSMSLVADLYSPKERTIMISYLSTITGIGVGTGQNVGGVVGPLLGWRYAFILVSLPAFLVAMGMYFLTVEPVRGCLDIRADVDPYSLVSGEVSTCVEQAPELQEEEDNASSDDETHRSEELNKGSSSGKSSYEESCREADNMENDESDQPSVRNLKNQSSLAFKWRASLSYQMNTVGYVLSIPSVAIACGQGVVGCVPWGVVATFLNDYLAQDRNLGVLAATLVQTLLGIGGLIGTVLGGYFGQKFYNVRPYQMSLFMGTAAIASAFPFIILVNLPSGAPIDDDQKQDDMSSNSGGVLGGGGSWQLVGVYMVMSFITGIFICMTGNCVASMVQNTVSPDRRGSAFAIFNLSDDVGRGLGPLAVAWLVLGFDGHRRPAFSVAAIGWILCGILNCFSAWTIEKDISKVVASISQAAQPKSTVCGDGVDPKKAQEVNNPLQNSQPQRKATGSSSGKVVYNRIKREVELGDMGGAGTSSASGHETH